jgi:hypothetical protein
LFFFEADWSTDGRHIQSSCVAYELLFHDITADLVGSKQNTSATAVKNVQWVQKKSVAFLLRFVFILVFISFSCMKISILYLHVLAQSQQLLKFSMKPPNQTMQKSCMPGHAIAAVRLVGLGPHLGQQTRPLFQRGRALGRRRPGGHRR